MQSNIIRIYMLCMYDAKRTRNIARARSQLAGVIINCHMHIFMPGIIYSFYTYKHICDEKYDAEEDEEEDDAEEEKISGVHDRKLVRVSSVCLCLR